MKPRTFFYLLLLAFLSVTAFFAFNGISPAVSPDQPALVTATNPMMISARAFLASLSGDERRKALFPFDEAERENWNFVPMVRKGLVYQRMDEAQRRLCLELVQTGLSEKGFSQATGIMAWENILSDVEGRPRGNDYRNPEKYFLAIFGEPLPDKPWGWRFEGHHLSLNYTSVTGKLSVTPHFMGANPARVPVGDLKGRRLLPEEEDLGRRLVQSLDESQRRVAIISQKAFPDIVSGNERVASLTRKEGLPYEAMLPEQQEWLDMLIKVYLSKMKTEIADEKWAKIQREGLDKLHFAWAGKLQPGAPHYYRIHGQGFVIEYDNTQNNANHIHLVWREFEGDFGRDLLREHYRDSHRD